MNVDLDLEIVQSLQHGHGGWTDGMFEASVESCLYKDSAFVTSSDFEFKLINNATLFVDKRRNSIARAALHVSPSILSNRRHSIHLALSS